MVMSNLLLRIVNAGPEDITTEILASLLRDFSPCCSAFMLLIDPSTNSGDYEVVTQYAIYEGRPDLVLCNNNNKEIFLIENKPWDSSSLTGGDQLKRYANALKEKMSDAKAKTLCLLATKGNKDNLLKAIAVAEGEGIASDETSLKKHYACNYGIGFVVITWQQVLEQLCTIQPKHAVIDFCIEELRGSLFPPVVEIPSEVLQDEEKIWENWVEIKNVVKQARDITANDPSLSNYLFMPTPGYNSKPSAESRNYFGYYLYNKESDLAYFFGANIIARRFLKGQSLFVLQVRTRWDNLSGEKNSLIDSEALIKRGFEYNKPSSCYWWEFAEYVYPLTDSSDGTISSDKLSEALAVILKKLSEEE